MAKPQESRNPYAGRLGMIQVAFWIFCSLVLFFRFFRFPNIPIYVPAGDQPIFLMEAAKIVDGQTIYKDFFEFTTPGTQYLYALLIRLFGHTAILPRLVVFAIGAAFSIVGLLIARRILGGWQSYAAVLLFLTTGFLIAPDGSHHAFSTLCVLAALALLLYETDHDKSYRRLRFSAGALCGLSCFFTLNRGAIACAGFLAVSAVLGSGTRSNPVGVIRRHVGFVTGFVLVLLVLFTPVVWLVGGRKLFDSIVGFPLHNYRSVPWNDFRSYGTDFPIAGFGGATSRKLLTVAGAIAVFKWFLIYFISPGIYLIAAFRLRDRWAILPQKLRERLLSLLFTGVALFLSIVQSPNLYRMGIVSLPAIVLTVWVLDSAGAKTLRLLNMALAVFAVATFSAGVWNSQRHTSTVLTTPSGTVALPDSFADGANEKYYWLDQHVKPGDTLFGPVALDYYLYRLRNPAPIAFYSLYDYTTPSQVADTVIALERSKVRYVFWPVELQDVTVTTESPFHVHDHLGPLRDYLRVNYVITHRFEDFDEVWERN